MLYSQTIVEERYRFIPTPLGMRLPDFFDEHYPQFIGFLEKYYEYMEGNEAGSFSKQIQSLFESRTISNLEGVPRLITGGIK